MNLDIDAVIKTAKLGVNRRAAQEDTCSVFAAALYDVLKERGIHSRLFCVDPKEIGHMKWYHAVIKVGDTYYDSMGEFSEQIHRIRAKIHPTVKLGIVYIPDKRGGCYDSEFDEMHAFYVKMLNKALNTLHPELKDAKLGSVDGPKKPAASPVAKRTRLESPQM